MLWSTSLPSDARLGADSMEMNCRVSTFCMQINAVAESPVDGHFVNVDSKEFLRHLVERRAW